MNPGKLGSLGGLSGKKPEPKRRNPASRFNPKGESMMDSSSDENDSRLDTWKQQMKSGMNKIYAAPRNEKLSYLEHLDNARDAYRKN